MGPRSKRTAFPRVVPSLLLCSALLVSVLIVPGATWAIEPTQEVGGERVELQVWSPSSWMAWLLEWWTGGEVRVTEEAASSDSCIDPDCTPPDSETTTDGTGTEDDGGSDPTTEGGPQLELDG